MASKGKNFFPNLNNEKTGEQIVFEQKVFRANEAFRRKVDGLINWYISPSDCRTYPEEWNKN